MIWVASTQIGRAGPVDPARKSDPSGMAPPEMEIKDHDMRVLDDRIDWCVRLGITHLELWLNYGLKFPSHPELDTKGAFSAEEMNAFARRAKSRGVEVVPGLDLRATPGWLGEVGRMVSTPPYYRMVCDVLKDAYDAFDHPEFINVGMGEETPGMNCRYRRGELLYHDINLFGKVISKLGARPWMDADIIWHYGKEYCRKVSKDIVQSNWYYHPEFSPENFKVSAYNMLDEFGFDQIPLCSAYVGKDYGVKVNRENIRNTLKYCKETVESDRLIGYGVTRWHAPNDDGTRWYLEGWRYLDEDRRTYYPEEDKRVHAAFRKRNPGLPSREFPPLPVG